MTYEEALAFLNAPKYSETRPGLGPVTELMHRLGDPQDGLRYVHVAGTNGKGSTCAYVERALREAGYRTGLYTSPFLERFTERIQINGVEISEEDIARLTEKVKAASQSMLEDGLKEPTIFEMVTGVAFLYFAEQKCDIVVLEVGMGGRLDATNIIKNAEVSIITPLDLDHTEFLGNSLTDIAYEKAGIIKPNGMLVTCTQEPDAAEVIHAACYKENAMELYVETANITSHEADIYGQTFRFADQDIHIQKAGVYQARNAALAYAALKMLQEKGTDCEAAPEDQAFYSKLTDQAILDGLSKATWGGRFELMCDSPVFIIDGAHNPNGVGALTESLKSLLPDRKFVFLTGVLADKDYRSMLHMTEPLAKRYLTVTPDSPRALPAADLAQVIREDGFQAEAFGSIEEAADYALSLEEETVVAYGSLYYIGALRTYLTKRLEKKCSS